jgi:transposase InsO family protein
LKCQKCKVTRHIVTPLTSFKPPTARFSHVHIDLVGPLPPSEGQRYCPIAVDRFTRWPEAVPISDISAETVANAFYSHCVARFGCPGKITTNQGRQFDSQLFRALKNLCGAQVIHTTAYHPAANGLVERFHRTTKAALMCHEDSPWTRTLPTVLLGLPTAWKEDLQTTPAELVYGEPLHIPGEFHINTPVTDPQPSFFEDLRRRMAKLKPVSTSCHDQRSIFIHKVLDSSTHVFHRTEYVLHWNHHIRVHIKF